MEVKKGGFECQALLRLLVILLAVILLANCIGKGTNAEAPISGAVTLYAEKNESAVQTDNDTKEKAAPLMIGGKQYRGRLGRRVEVESGSWRIVGDPVDCTVEDIDKLIIVGVWLNPEDPERRNSLENLELLKNVEELTISGENLDKVDFFSVLALTNLEKLEIEGNIAHLPDLSNLQRLRIIEIKKAALVSFEGLGGVGVEDLNIGISRIDDNIVLKMSDIKDMGGLKYFAFEGGKIDLESIDRFVSLEVVSLVYCEPYNLNRINRLKNLRIIEINIISPNPSIEFLRDMSNLKIAILFGNYRFYDYSYPASYPDWREPTQELDVSPLATSKKLEGISCHYFIIKNISTLDVLENISPYIFLMGSRLYDETEKSKHGLSFRSVKD
jgi:hypothetical protein